jgi:hypothetical protein
MVQLAKGHEEGAMGGVEGSGVFGVVVFKVASTRDKG